MLHVVNKMSHHRYKSTFLTGSDFGQGGAPDAVGLHAAVEKLFLQTCPLGMSRADFSGGPGFAQLLSLPGGPLGRGLGPHLFSQDAVLQVGTEFTHGLAQSGHEKDRTEAGRAGVWRGCSQLGADGGQDVANTSQAAFA